ncbi:NADH:flavin oxidoreductase [Halobacillus litoralis]|uniref:NADH:flavin oxidoreductase n=1 Tax=Halobacillus litoralis TaxID=45668 RepID=A0A845DUT5_9BACI|nr:MULTISPECIES: NADH:flavin oxidoreductase [Halobacillus]MYL21260.1 NADH:flavin oxidoreductase [Halobacillus litoralis]MYL30295.1 NADH:flavin oxidoreductase [Halobacillus halophilus]
MTSDITPLFEEKIVQDNRFKNRYIVAPMTRVSAANNGTANERMKQYYERYAKGGFGAVISEGIYPDRSYSQGYWNQPGLADEQHRDAWKPIVRGVHHHGALFIAQIMHAGAQSQGNAYANAETIAPSAVAPKNDQLPFYGGKGPFPTPKAASHEELEEIKQSFAQSARLAKEAGFDGVELHGANGYLLDQFITDYFNQRDDQYGGTTTNRMRYILEVIKEVRKEVGHDYLLGIRISQGKASDGEHRWALGETDAKTIFGELGKSPLDFIHVTDKDGTASSFGEGSLSMAAAAKLFSGLPVIANGGLHETSKALQLLNSEEADFVSLGTGALQNPDAPNRIRQGQSLEPFDFSSIMLPQAEIKDHELKKEVRR